MPGATLDAELELYGRARLDTEPWGIMRSIVFARATDERARSAGQDGGVASGLLVWGLETGRIDGAVTAARDGVRPWEGKPTVATDWESVLRAAGSRYSYCPTPLGLEAAIAKGLSRLALVGTSCQASVPAVMGAHRLNKWRRRVSWTLGLFCSKTFTYEGLIVDGLTATLGINAASIKRMDVKGRVSVELIDHRVFEVPLTVARQWSRAGCAFCTDFAAEHADISLGGIGQTDRWTLAVVRTDVGVQVWADAVADGVVEQREVDEETKQALARMSAAQRRRRTALIEVTRTVPGDGTR